MKMNKAVKEKRRRQLKILRKDVVLFFFFFPLDRCYPMTDMYSKFPVML